MATSVCLFQGKPSFGITYSYEDPLALLFRTFILKGVVFLILNNNREIKSLKSKKYSSEDKINTSGDESNTSSLILRVKEKANIYMAATNPWDLHLITDSYSTH